MYKEVYKSPYIIVRFNEHDKILHTEYLKKTADMSDNDWKELMVELKEVYEQNPPLYIIDDNRNRLYEYPPEIQQWTLQLFTEQWNKSGLKKIVQIAPADIIGKLTQMQIIELVTENFKLKFEVHICPSFDKAIAIIKQ